ncbi:PAQR family membrane homeostasis protein TrhA [Roseovarius ramblicola]|uniref:Hemolysin III family protein n=1 Tax=Roseovarius ramblicola TaxID=2022336 RepID=A0ABV5HW77_9RHOB
MTKMPYPLYTPAERIADGVVHIGGLVAALAGVAAVYSVFALDMDGVTFLAITVYSLSLLAMLAASAAYHLLAHTPLRPLLRRLDHAAIYVKIAGTFTPLGILLGSAFGYAVLAGVWLCAGLGALGKLRMPRGAMTTGWLPYMLLGWAGVALIMPLSGVLPGVSLAFIVGGGLLYSVGVIFYAWESLRFANAIWHTFVALASACFFIGINTAVAAAL